MGTNKPEKVRHKISIGIGVFALICIPLGLLVFCGAEYIISVEENTDFSLFTTFIKGVSAIAINLIVIALISLLIELTSIRKYIDDIVSQIVIDMEKLIANKYTWDYSSLDAKDLEEHLYLVLEEIVKKGRQQEGISIPEENDNILKMTGQLLQNLLSDFMCGEYYEDYNINLRLLIENQAFVKYVVTTSYLITNSSTKTFRFYAVYPTEETWKSLCFERVLIYSKDRKKIYFDLTAEVNKNIKLVRTKDKQRHHNIYCIESYADFSELMPNDYYVEYTRSYLKYIKNGVFVHSVPKPVKDFRAEIILEQDSSNQYKLYGLSFCPYKQVHTQQDLRMEEQNLGPHSLTIHNSNWCLPGTGFCIMVMENIDLLETNN